MGTQTHTHESVFIDTQCTLGGQTALQRRFLPYETGGPLRFGRRLHTDGDAAAAGLGNRRRRNGGVLVGQIVERLERAAGRQRRSALHRRRSQALVDGVLVAQEKVVEAATSRRPTAGRLQVRLSVSAMAIDSVVLWHTSAAPNALTSCRPRRRSSAPP